MNILLLSAGTGSFLCGTCLRDDALAQGLKVLGHGVRLIPLYLPLVTDRADAKDDDPVLLGGVSAYLQQHSAFCRLLPAWMDKALDSRAMLSLAAKRAGATNPAELGPMTRSMLAGEEGFQAKAIGRLCDALEAMVPRPDVVVLSNALLLGLARPIKATLGCPVVSTLQGEDAFLDALPEAERKASWALCAAQDQEVNQFIAVSAYHREVMRHRLGLPSERVHVVHNGLDLEGYASADHAPSRPTVGYLARLCVDKGLMALVEAYIALRQTWEGPAPALLLGGARTALDKPILATAVKRLTDAGVADQLEVHPNMSRKEKQRFLRRLTLMCVPVQVSESFGLYALEAMASGVPVVAYERGGLEEIITLTGGGVMSRDERPEALAGVLAELLSSPERARTLGALGRHAVVESFNVAQMAKGVAQRLAEVCA